MSIIQNDLTLSNSQTLKLAGHIRYATASLNAIEPSSKQKLFQLQDLLNRNFTLQCDTFLMRESEKENLLENTPTICCNDVNFLIEVIEEFKGQSYSQAKIVLDSVGGFR